MYLGQLIEFGATARMLAHPRESLTHDYIHGGFG